MSVRRFRQISHWAQQLKYNIDEQRRDRKWILHPEVGTIFQAEAGGRGLRNGPTKGCKIHFRSSRCLSMIFSFSVLSEKIRQIGAVVTVRKFYT